jgi:hypothetical protein
VSAAGKGANKTTWKVRFRGLVSPPWQTLLCLWEFLSQKQNDWHPITSLPSGFRAIQFISFPKLKTVLRRRRFNDNRNVSKQSPNILTNFQAMHCTKYLEQWCNHWACCVQPKRDYSEVDNTD